MLVGTLGYHVLLTPDVKPQRKAAITTFKLTWATRLNLARLNFASCLVPVGFYVYQVQYPYLVADPPFFHPLPTGMETNLAVDINECPARASRNSLRKEAIIHYNATMHATSHLNIRSTLWAFTVDTNLRPHDSEMFQGWTGPTTGTPIFTAKPIKPAGSGSWPLPFTHFLLHPHSSRPIWKTFRD